MNREQFLKELDKFRPFVDLDINPIELFEHCEYCEGIGSADILDEDGDEYYEDCPVCGGNGLSDCHFG